MYPEMKEPSDLRDQIVSKSSVELSKMCLKPHNWLPQSIAIAQEELTRRGVPVPGPAPKPPEVRTVGSVAGFGTELYGKRDFKKDGSYLTTEWVVLFGIPISPVLSVRILGSYLHHDEDELPAPPQKRLLMGEITKPNIKQVVFVYAYMLIVAVWTVMVLRIALAIPPKEMTTVVKSALVVVECVPIPLPWILRHIAIWALKQESGKSSGGCNGEHIGRRVEH